MTIYSAVRAIFTPDSQVLLGHGIVSGIHLITSLHVLDLPLLKELKEVQLARPGSQKLTRCSLSILEVVTASDVVIYKLNNSNEIPYSRIQIVEEVKIGDCVVIPFLNQDYHSILRYSTIYSTVRDKIIVDQYMYFSASNKNIQVNNLIAFFLSHPINQGVSGAPVYLKGSNKVISFVHGNADENYYAAICLNQQPLIDIINI